MIDQQGAKTESGIPIAISAAQEIDFEMPITGFLCRVQLLAPFLVGMVFGDQRERFKDGTTIRTSPIARAFMHKGYPLCETFGGSRYVICHWLDETAEATGQHSIH